jgi:hypothetical protein
MSGFKKTGIIPFNPDVVLSKLAIKSKHNPPLLGLPLQTPHLPPSGIQQPQTSVHEVRKLVKTVQSSLARTETAVAALIETAEILSFENDLLKHQKNALEETILTERQRRKKGKKMGLLTPEKPKFGQFWSPEKFQRVKQAKQADEAAKQAQKDAKTQLKIRRKEKQRLETDRKAENKRLKEAKQALDIAKKETKRKAREDAQMGRDPEK